MLSYRHGFHAGNFADVHKHCVLVEVLDYLKRKAKPLSYIDTHAGGGSYDLASDFAQKKREFDDGIGRLWADEGRPLARYLTCVRTFNADAELTQYPGSPALARMLLGAEDRLILFERHRNEALSLRGWAEGDRRVTVREEDGFSGCIGLLPPPSRRGLLLMDPAYELKSDDDDVVRTLAACHRRFGTGVYLLWYPVVDRSRTEAMLAALVATGIRRIDRYELGVAPDGEGFGMTASGLLVINPPFTLRSTMEQVLPWLAQRLGREGQGWSRCETLVSE
ncbi:MAG: 23S rRNA (adenine(2030)-N(6))-methyltransferase RlmJ [Gammaproteobacteria bacterium]|nr:MAG: 23S rRNA (adenine(2030)-N(6))-methyltransferase RlmJ [Gammaproteobacteria bacterium]